VRARNKVERKIRDAIRAGVLPASSSFAQKELLDKIKPHIDDQMLDQIKRAVVAGDIYGHGEVYYFAPADAIRWASSKDSFPRFFQPQGYCVSRQGQVVVDGHAAWPWSDTSSLW